MGMILNVNVCLMGLEWKYGIETYRLKPGWKGGCYCHSHVCVPLSLSTNFIINIFNSFSSNQESLSPTIIVYSYFSFFLLFLFFYFWCYGFYMFKIGDEDEQRTIYINRKKIFIEDNFKLRFIRFLHQNLMIMIILFL